MLPQDSLNVSSVSVNLTTSDCLFETVPPFYQQFIYTLSIAWTITLMLMFLTFRIIIKICDYIIPVEQTKKVRSFDEFEQKDYKSSNDVFICTNPGITPNKQNNRMDIKKDGNFANSSLYKIIKENGTDYSYHIIGDPKEIYAITAQYNSELDIYIFKNI